MDEFIDNLLRNERYCDIQLPRLQKRSALEHSSRLELYVSPLHKGPSDSPREDQPEEVEPSTGEPTEEDPSGVEVPEKGEPE